MQALASAAPRPGPGSTFLRAWWPLALGWSCLLGATAVRFAQTVWQSGEQSFGPFVLAVALFLFWSKRSDFVQARRPESAWPGWLLIACGLLLYLFGVLSKIAVIEGASHLAIVAGMLWLIGGAALIRRLWFPLLYLVLVVPIPSYLMSAATGGLKQFVSQASESLLYALAYPIGRTGVTLTIGSYQLLVADACSGMNSILSLTAIGLLFIYLVQPPRRWQVALLVLSILPIAIVANIARVTTLVLVTYYLGDEAGQGFLHEFAGLLMFVVAVCVLFSIDVVSRRLDPGRSVATHG
jgi:exosortase B